MKKMLPMHHLAIALEDMLATKDKKKECKSVLIITNPVLLSGNINNSSIAVAQVTEITML